MATKLKNWTYKPLVKLVCFIVVSVLIITSVLAVINNDYKRSDFYKEVNKESNVYKSNFFYGNQSMEKEEFSGRMISNYMRQAAIVGVLESEEAIKTEHRGVVTSEEWLGETVTQEDFTDDAYEYVDGEWYYTEDSYSSDNGYSVASLKYISTITGSTFDSLTSALSYNIELFSSNLKELESSGLSYEIITGTKVYKNGKSDEPYFMSIDNLILSKNIEDGYNSISTDSEIFNTLSEDTRIYIGTDGSGYEKYRGYLQQENQIRGRLYIILSITFILALAAVFILIIGAGRESSDKGKEIHFNFWDKPYLDVSLGIIAAVSGIIIAWVSGGTQIFFKNSYQGDMIVGLFIAICPLILLFVWFLSFVKRFKAGKWWQHTLTVRVFRIAKNWIVRNFTKIKNGIANGWYRLGGETGSKYPREHMIALVILMLITAIPGLFVITIPIMCYVIYLFHRDLGRIQTGIQAVERGEFNQKIDVARGVFVPTARSIESISANMDKAVEGHIKSERMKTELITNVSHDLRTPLTSIITYADLLKSKGLDNPEAPEHLDILIQKADRLKQLTDDLFEATKASSGNVKVNIETLDFAQLFNQCFGEMEEQNKQNLEFIFDMPEKAMILADGRLMQRVIENLLSNTFKYSLEKSRVYADMTEDGNYYKLEIKNISSYKLNISPDQLTERFSRGDESRTTEGSGLGLSIVEGFMQSQNGQFKLSIDGDLFKATVLIPKYYEKTS